MDSRTVVVDAYGYMRKKQTKHRSVPGFTQVTVQDDSLAKNVAGKRLPVTNKKCFTQPRILTRKGQGRFRGAGCASSFSQDNPLALPQVLGSVDR